MRIFAVSDLHVDYEENAKWVANLSNAEFKDDALILAGDISDVPSRIADCFEHLAKKFHTVFFVPGNHDIWVNRHGPQDSLEKFYSVIELAESFGVMTKRARFGKYTIVPIFSWYDYSFGTPTDYIKTAWMDFRRCRWPETMSDAKKICEFFLNENRVFDPEESEYVITFSHFLPRIDVMPAFIPRQRREIYPVLGSAELDTYIRRLNPKLHVYGHSHVNRCVKIDGVFYLNNAFGYPSEERIARKCLVNVLDEIS